MSTTERIRQIRECVERTEAGVSIVDSPRLDACDVCVQAETTLAFFKLIEEPEALRVSWLAAQGQIASWWDDAGHDRSPSDLYLVLLLDGAGVHALASAQAIASDPYVCRKVLREWGSRDPNEVLRSLPFWPLLSPTEEMEDVPDPATALARYGYSPKWTEALMERSAPERIADRLVSATLKIRGTAPGDRPSARVRTQNRDQRRHDRRNWRLGRMEVEGFRGYHARFPIDLGAGLVVVYGRNGTGKTSLCEAVEWSLLGEVERLKRESPDAPQRAAEKIICLWSDQASVTIESASGDAEHRVQRTLDREGTESYQFNGRTIPTERERVFMALDACLPEQPHVKHARDAFRQYHILDQDEMQTLLWADSPADRYSALQPMLGTAHYGRLNTEVRRVSDELARRFRGIGVLLDQAVAHTEQCRHTMQIRAEEVGRCIQPHLGEDMEQLYAAAVARAARLQLVRHANDKQGSGHVQAFVALADEALAQAIPDWEAKVVQLRTLGDDVQERPSIDAAIIRLLAELGELRAKYDRANAEHESGAALLSEYEAALVQVEEELLCLRERRSRLEHAVRLQKEMDERSEQRARLARESSAAADDLQRVSRQLAAARREHRAASGVTASLGRAKAEQQQRIALLQTASHSAEIWREATQTREEAIEREPALAAEIREVKERIPAEEELASALRETGRQLDTRAEQLSAVVSSRNRLVAELQHHVSTNRCPACGSEWPTTDALLQAVASMLSGTPQEVIELETQRAENQAAARKQSTVLEHLRSQCERLSQQHEALRGHIQQLEQTQAECAACIAAAVGCTPAEPDLPLRIRRARHDTNTALQDVTARLDVASNELAEWSVRVSELGKREAERREAHLSKAAQSAQAEETVEQLRRQLDEVSSREQWIGDLATALSQTGAEVVSREQERDSRLAMVKSQREKQVALEGSASALRARGRVATRELSDQKSRAEAIRRSLSDSGLPADASHEMLLTALRTADEHLDSIREFSSLMVSCRAYSRLLDAREAQAVAAKALDDATTRQRDLERELHRLQGLVDQCDEFLGHLREVTASIEERRLGHYQPWVRLFYERLSTHPYLGPLNLVVDHDEQEFRIQFDPPQGEVGPIAARDYLSMAQVNVVALSIFLASALLQGWSSLRTVILDDPVQHMDDMNALALLDLLHSFASLNRQVIVTTAHMDLYKLMLVRFAPMNRERGDAFRAYRLLGVRREGPELRDDTFLGLE